MGIITDILKEIPLSAILKERLSEEETKASVLEAENKLLKAENLVLKRKNAELHIKLVDAEKKIKELSQPNAFAQSVRLRRPDRGLSGL